MTQKRIMEFMQVERAQTPDGVNVHAIHRNTGGSMTLESVREQIERLVDEGMAYVTIDDDQ